MPRPREEVRSILKVAMPLVAAYLAEMAMFNTTRIVVGQLGYRELAAVGLGSHVTFEIIIVLMGLLSVVGVLVANAEGGGKKHEAGHATRQGLILATVLGVPGTVMLWNFGPVLVLLGQPEEVVVLSDQYLTTVSFTVLPTMWFACFRNFATAIAKTGVIMVITVTAVGLNYFFTVAFVHGQFGMPEMGVAGAGWATSVVAWIMLVVMIVYIYLTPIFRGYGLFKGRIRLDITVCREIVNLGIPVAGLVMLEASLFLAVAIISGILGTVTLATYEILIGWLGVAFVIALALAETSMVRVAFGMGRDSLASARQSGILSMVMGAGLLAAMTVVPMNFEQQVVDIFLDESDPGFLQVSELAGELFYIVALFQVFDGLQAVASRSLRGIKDTIAPLWLAGIGYWLLGIGGGYVLTFPLGYGAQGMWWGLAAGLTFTAILMTVRFLRLTAPSRVPPRATEGPKSDKSLPSVTRTVK